MLLQVYFFAKINCYYGLGIILSVSAFIYCLSIAFVFFQDLLYFQQLKQYVIEYDMLVDSLITKVSFLCYNIQFNLAFTLSLQSVVLCQLVCFQLMKETVDRPLFYLII